MPRFWKSKLFVLPAMNDRLPSPPSTRQASTLSLISPSPPTPRTASPVVSSFYQSTEASNTRDQGVVPFILPDSPPPRSGWGFGPSARPPPRHRVDVPGPAFSTTGTEHSTRLADLAQQILSLEGEIRTRQDAKHDGAPKYQPAEGRMSVADLRERVRQLRAQVQRERRLLTEALPHMKR